MTIHVLHPGALATIQDKGRYGYQQFGVIASGAMDPYSLRIANWLVGNPENEGALEVTMFGTSLQFERDTVVAITGADLTALIDSEPAPTWRPLLIRKGSILKFKAARQGSRAYVAVAGGFDVPAVMGSKSTYLKAGIGGFQGRALKKGDRLAIGTSFSERNQTILEQLEREPAKWSVRRYDELLRFGRKERIRVVRGTEFARFDTASRQRLYEEQYTLTTDADRMGFRFTGTALSLEQKFELLSEGVTYGTVQIPSNGQPIILMADRQTTGGYPKIAQVITADLPTLAQLQPNATIQFEEVSLEEAELQLQFNERILKDIKIGIDLKLK
ncbi:allophanate hydrolase subunit 2 [Bacillus sp. OxB-1]|uniref:5-oxoprolinase subunit C family protein n=1 Tax=Bacillus sp. (strain OxB-1) TaxID=98228 RepID=UPI00058201E2|nr:biotin-dependent carboxyltransferase family protein [Bacillus sp. OxB-1]BAQ10628.1 allophanate hydrolase subunit 2 [Bacillus sp. OxB-1]